MLSRSTLLFCVRTEGGKNTVCLSFRLPKFFQYWHWLGWDDRWHSTSDFRTRRYLQTLMAVLTQICFDHIPAKKSSRKYTAMIPRHRRILIQKRRKLIIKLESTTLEDRKSKIRDQLIKIEQWNYCKITEEATSSDGNKNKSKVFLLQNNLLLPRQM